MKTEATHHLVSSNKHPSTMPAEPWLPRSPSISSIKTATGCTGARCLIWLKSSVSTLLSSASYTKIEWLCLLFSLALVSLFDAARDFDKFHPEVFAEAVHHSRLPSALSTMQHNPARCMLWFNHFYGSIRESSEHVLLLKSRCCGQIRQFHRVPCRNRLMHAQICPEAACQLCNVFGRVEVNRSILFGWTWRRALVAAMPKMRKHVFHKYPVRSNCCSGLCLPTPTFPQQPLLFRAQERSSTTKNLWLDISINLSCASPKMSFQQAAKDDHYTLQKTTHIYVAAAMDGISYQISDLTNMSPYERKEKVAMFLWDREAY